MGYDWNKNGKGDSFDSYIDYKLFSSNSKQKTNEAHSNYSSKNYYSRKPSEDSSRNNLKIKIYL